MEYPNIIAAVPQGEHFDASAVNEGVWISQAHLDNLETTLAANATSISGHETIVTGITGERDQLTANLATANQTIATRDASILAKDAEIATLKAAAAKPLSTTTSQADDLNDNSNTAVVSEITLEAQRLRALRDGKKK